MRKIRYLPAAVLAVMLPALALAGGEPPKDEAQPETTFVQVLSVVTAQSEPLPARQAVVKTAQRDGTAPLFAAPDEDSSVLMAYYSGAPVEALRMAGAGMVQVQAGRQGAGIMGYMRESDLETGDAAQRVVAPAYMELQFNREAPVYAYCDEGAEAIGVCEPGKTYYAMGKNEDNWVQLWLPPAHHIWEEESRMTAGFVKLETGLARGFWRELHEWTVAPRAGEITPEQAAELAIAHLERTGDHGLPEIYTQRSALEAMHSRAQYIQTEDSLINDWRVYFWESDGSDCVRVYVYTDGQGQVTAHHDYIAAGETYYGVCMKL